MWKCRPVHPLACIWMEAVIQHLFIPRAGGKVILYKQIVFPLVGLFYFMSLAFLIIDGCLEESERLLGRTSGVAFGVCVSSWLSQASTHTPLSFVCCPYGHSWARSLLYTVITFACTLGYSDGLWTNIISSAVVSAPEGEQASVLDTSTPSGVASASCRPVSAVCQAWCTFNFSTWEAGVGLCVEFRARQSFVETLSPKTTKTWRRYNFHEQIFRKDNLLWK